MLIKKGMNETCEALVFRADCKQFWDISSIIITSWWMSTAGRKPVLGTSSRSCVRSDLLFSSQASSFHPSLLLIPPVEFVTKMYLELTVQLPHCGNHGKSTNLQ